MTYRREFTWYRQISPPTIAAQGYSPGESKPVTDGVEGLGFELVRAPALYDIGEFIVLDTVKDLLFVVFRVDEDGIPRALRAIELDKYEAIRVADEFKEASE